MNASKPPQLTLWARLRWLGAGGLIVALTLWYASPEPNEVYTPDANPTAVPAIPGVRPQAEVQSTPPRGTERQRPPTLSEMLLLEGDFAQTAALYNAAAQADETGLHAWFREADTLRQISERGAVRAILYSRYADLDPEAALAHALAARTGDRNRAIGVIFHTWSRQDLDAAMAALQSLPMLYRQPAAVAVLRARDDLDPSLRTELGADMGFPQLAEQLSAQQRWTEATDDPEAAWAELASQPASQQRLQQQMQLLQIWARSDPLAALAAMGTLPPAARGMEQMVVSVWAQSNPGEALEWAMSQPASDQRAGLISSALASLASVDLQTAISITETLEAEDLNRALASVAGIWSHTDAEQAARWVQSFDNSRATRSAASSVAHAFAQQAPREALDWSLELPTEVRQSVLWSLTNVIAQQDGAQLMRWIDELEEGPIRTEYTQAAVNGLASYEPTRAIRWLEDMPAELQTQMVGTVVGQWMNVDPDAAMSYVDRIGDDVVRDAALVSAVAHLAADPERAMALSQEVSNAQQRAAAEQQVYYMLRRFDPEAASEFAEEHNLAVDDSG